MGWGRLIHQGLWVALWAAAGLAALQCSDQIEVNAPYRERAAVYAMLNVRDTVHYIRIQKTFLNIEEPDAFKAAKVKDSIYYTGEDVLDVRLYLEMPRIDTIELGRLERVEGTGKDTGVFYAPDYLVYRFRGTLIPEDSVALRLAMFRTPQILTQRKIRLEILNMRTGYHVQARTRLVYPIWDDAENSPFYGRYSLLEPVRYPDDRGRQLIGTGPSVRFSRHLNGAVFKAVLYMPYEEVYPGGRRDTLEAQWTIMADREVLPTEITVSRSFGPDDDRLELFETLLAQVDTTKPVAYRKLLPMRVRVLAADSNLYNYVLTSSQYSVITQTAPIYSNIENGLGLLTSRSDHSFQATLFRDAFNVLNAYPYASMRFREH